jgi:hypothetical protein
MKKALLSTLLLFAASYGFADAPAPAPAPTIVGTWNLTGLECSSGTPVSGGIKIGEDTMKGTFNADNTASYASKIGGCDMTAKGTYKLEGSLLTTTITEGQSCKDTAPVPMNETKSVFVAHMGEAEIVTVATGKDAAAVCPAGDALVSHFAKEVVTP